jgi:hypothetical protein
LAVAISVAVDLGGSFLAAYLHSAQVGGRSMLLVRNNVITRRRISIVLVAALMPLASCNKAQKPAPGAAVQRSFASPEEAGTALVTAARSSDQSALLAIFGPEAKDVLSIGDAVEDQNHLKEFVASYDQMHRWATIKAGGQILYTGPDNSPFPIPLYQNSSGQWSFDTAAGKDEILARRIGRGELIAIAACDAIAAAQQQYFHQMHDKQKEYAQKFVSDNGMQDGLYWQVSGDQAPSPLADLGDLAKAVGYAVTSDKPQPFNGYYFQMLTKQGDKAQGGAKDYLVDGKLVGGFAILAYPAEYRNSGIMTFLVGKDGVVYQKDLGEKTAEIAAATREYNPGDGWSAVFGTESASMQ